MKGRLALLNFALAALVALGGWQLRVKWLEARAREADMYSRQVRPQTPPPPVPVPAAEPVTAAGYSEVAQKMLFAKDRNPVVEIDVVPPKPMPPMPVAFGVMAFGDVRSAILSPKPGAPHRAFSPGDMVGEFKLVSVDPEELVFEWEGQTIVKRVEELMAKDHGASAAQQAEATAVPPPPAAQPVTTTVTAPVKPGPGAELTTEMRACQPGDPSPAGTVMNGMRKIVTRTPFGEACRWEPAR